MGSDHNPSSDPRAKGVVANISTIVSELVHLSRRTPGRGENPDGNGSWRILPRIAGLSYGANLDVHGESGRCVVGGEAYDYTITKSAYGIQFNVHRRGRTIRFHAQV